MHVLVGNQVKIVKLLGVVSEIVGRQIVFTGFQMLDATGGERIAQRDDRIVVSVMRRPKQLPGLHKKLA